MTLSCLNTRCVEASYPGRTLEQDVQGKAIKRCGSVYISSHSRQQRVTPFRGKNISTSDWDSNPDLPVFGSLAYCESDALDHAATEAGSSKPRLKMCELEDERKSIPLLISRKLWSL
uniref:Uncharacterized protein n=1 Tax=Timema shepardi TaxID=629360 RepID=A0A7R9AQR5_TIMSH|nr:unnamed protein product [Timema shepardi]